MTTLATTDLLREMEPAVESNLNRHRVSFHGGKGGFLCGVDGCDVRFTRKDNVYKHRDVVHGVRRKPKKKQQRQ